MHPDGLLSRMGLIFRMILSEGVPGGRMGFVEWFVAAYGDYYWVLAFRDEIESWKFCNDC